MGCGAGCAPRTSLDHAERSVAAFEAEPPDRRNWGSERKVRMQQVRAHFTLGQLDGAELALTPVLETAPEHRVRPLLVRMNDVYTAAAGKPNEPIAKRIRDEVQAFQRGAAPQELLP